MAQPPNGTTALFQSLTDEDDFIDPDYNYEEAFWKAIQVFVMSYPELNVTNTDWMREKFDHYFDTMAQLFRIDSPDPQLVDSLFNEVRAESYSIEIRCKRIRGRDRLTNANLVAIIQGEQHVCNLDLSRNAQPFNPLSITVDFDTYQNLRVDHNQMITLTIEDEQTAQPHQQFELPFWRIHPEGFEDWLDFGSGVHLLICIENTVIKDEEEEEECTENSKCHLHSIEMMVGSRLSAYTVSRRWEAVAHHHTNLKYDVSYRRPLVDPETPDYFWTEPEPKEPFIGIPVVGELRRSRRPTVKFNDMQIGFKTNEDFVDRVCLCNEWCNYNAFFYYNPVYRFLIVRHRQLYLKNIANIPDMYLCLPVNFGSMATPSFKTPVLLLINSANEYRNKYFDGYYLKGVQEFIVKYHTSYPDPERMNALTYNKLRDEFEVMEIINALDDNPFADICVESLLLYYNVLIDLHNYHLMNTDFVDDDELWNNDLDTLGRHNYTEYFKNSYDKCMATHGGGGYDFLFTVDYGYGSQMAETEALREIKKARDTIMRRVMADSPFNLMVVLNKFLNTFVMISEFMVRVEPKLPGVYKQPVLTAVLDCYRQMDTDFNDYCEQNEVFNYKIDSNESVFNYLRKNFEVFYTLKLYFYAFEIQKRFISAVINMNKHIPYKSVQVCPAFDFIWDKNHIEHRFRNEYTNERLYKIFGFKQVFNDFYQRFWGRARHENEQLSNLVDSIESAHYEYQRLHFWWKNNGNNKRIFNKIIEVFTNNTEDIISRSEDILTTHIKTACAYLANITLPSNSDSIDLLNEQENVNDYQVIQPVDTPYEGVVEVFDHLVYYLMKANCSVILSTTAKFLKQIHRLQDVNLTKRGISYSLCKPGWIPLFKTMFTLLKTVDGLNTRFIDFDDECDRICDTCLQTRKLIKNIYRQFYSKLSIEWIREMEHILQSVAAPTPEVTEFLFMHLAVGLAFVSVFIDDFRIEFCVFRKRLMFDLNLLPNTDLEHQVQFAQCMPVVNNYIKDRKLIASAQPFNAEIWRTHFTQLFDRLDQLNGQQLNINLNAADV